MINKLEMPQGAYFYKKNNNISISKEKIKNKKYFSRNIK